MKPKRIVIDGKTYDSVNDMPPDVRRQYDQAMRAFKDQDGNHIPDAIDHDHSLDDMNRNSIPDIVENTAGAPIVANAMKVLFDGREFNSIDELPPDARAKYDQAMGTLDANRNGIPDFVEEMIGGTFQQSTSNPVSTGFATDTTRHASRQPMPFTPTIEPDRSNGWLLGLLAGLLFLVCVAAAAGGIWYFYLR